MIPAASGVIFTEAITLFPRLCRLCSLDHKLDEFSSGRVLCFTQNRSPSVTFLSSYSLDSAAKVDNELGQSWLHFQEASNDAKRSLDFSINLSFPTLVS